MTGFLLHAQFITAYDRNTVAYECLHHYQLPA
jgi:hypothetical protein